MIRFRNHILFVITAVLAMLPSAWGQTTFATITGAVTDASGAVIPKADIVATHVESNYRYTTVSNETGVFTLPQLREGVYTITVNAPGFREFHMQDIALVSRDVRRVDVHLEIGDVGSRVEVVGGATLIETESA